MLCCAEIEVEFKQQYVSTQENTIVHSVQQSVICSFKENNTETQPFCQFEQCFRYCFVISKKNIVNETAGTTHAAVLSFLV